MQFQKLKQKRQEIIKQLPAWDGVIRGTLRQYFLTCGKAGCRCQRSKRFRHGPYWYVAVSGRKGKNKMRMFSAKQLPPIRQGIAAYERLWEGLCEISEINMELIKMMGKQE